MSARLAALSLLTLAACSAQTTAGPSDAAPVLTAAPTAAPTATAAAAPSAIPTASAAPSAEPAASAEPATSAEPAEPLPLVKVVNIGMHIGGGPNDDITKEPIRRSVHPHFDAFRRCYRLAEEQKKGDFGVDLRIDKAGGKAQVSHPRTALKGKAFKECVVKVFEEIDFLKPKGGTTTVSYSLRFTPGRE